ncbi:MAG TPA: CbiX/SirB N-terminal domain-containing protein [Magnetovibrio sp.]
MAETPDFRDAALLIAAHGSPGSRGGRTSTRKHAQSIANLDLFAEVAAGFLTEKPFAGDVLDGFTAPDVYVVPNMTANGYITTTKLPQALGLTGPVTERIGPHGRQRIILTEPVGTHPLVPRIMANRIKNAMQSLNLDAPETTLVVVGHGSTKSRESFAQTEHVADEINELGLEVTTVTAYLEEPTFVKDWTALSDAHTFVFAPFLVSDGFHGSQDIPLAIGFDPADAAFQENLAQGRINETLSQGRRVIYLPPVGDDADMADIVLARVRQAGAVSR